MKIEPSNHPYVTCTRCGKYVGHAPSLTTVDNICTCSPYPPFNMGWICPNCGAAVSPSTMICPLCSPTTITYKTKK